MEKMKGLSFFSLQVTATQNDPPCLNMLLNILDEKCILGLESS